MKLYIRALRWSLIVLAGGVQAAGSDYLIDTWQTEDGLPHSSVTAIAQTPDGYLWIGTYNGLARFDGVRFTIFDPGNTPALTHARVAWLGVDVAGALWVNTEDGALAIREADDFQLLRAGGRGSVRGKTLTAAGRDVLLLAADGKLWRRIGRPGGTNQLELLNPPGGGDVTSVGSDATGRVWCLYGRGKIARWTREGFEGPLPDLGLEGKLIHSLESDDAGRIWMCTEQELAMFDGTLHSMTPTNSPQGLVFTGMTRSGDGAWVVANGRLRRCVARQWVADAGALSNRLDRTSMPVGEHVDRQGGLWFTHYGSGVLHVRPDGAERWLKMKDGLPGERVACWLEDREGNVWLGVNRAGLVRVRSRQFQAVGLAEGLRERTAMSVCEDRAGAIWIGTFGGGLNRWADGVMEAFDVGVGDRNVVASVYPDRSGRVWVGTGGTGVMLWDNGELKKPLGTNRPSAGHAALEDRRGQVWIGNASGLFRWANGNLHQFGTAEGFHARSARAIAEDTAGGIWVGTTEGSLFRWKDERFMEFRPTDALARQPVWSLLSEPDGTLWVGTFRGGLLRFQDGVFTRYRMKDGLPSDVICSILDDGDGKLWMSSHAGIFRVTQRALHAFARGESKSVPCVAYGRDDGLPTVECSGNYQPAGWRGRDGRLWFATVKGAVSVQPAGVITNALPPPVVIEEVWVDGKSEIRNPKSARLEIGPGRHFVEFRFTGLSFSAPDKVRFRHRLEGLEGDWVEDGARRSANYSYVPPGDYRFQVKACNNDGVWNETGAMLALTVVPFVWQTWWFKALGALAFFGVIGGAIRRVERRKLQRALTRLEKQHAVEQERSRIARDIHDDLGASLTQVALLGEMAERGAAEPNEVRARSRRISSAAREMARTLEAIVWAVRPENDTLASLVGYLDRRADELLDSGPLRYRFEAPRDLPARVVSAEMRHNIFLAFKEALTNALKHSGATELRIAVTLDAGDLRLAIEDNGRGFEPANIREDGTGVANMRRRMEDIGGRFELRTEAGNGTTVRLSVRLEARP